MTDNLVKRLREYRLGCGLHCSAYDAREPLDECIEAADLIEKLEAANLKQSLIMVGHLSRIEQLETALQAIIRYAGNTGDDYLADQARKSLEGKDD